MYIRKNNLKAMKNYKGYLVYENGTILGKRGRLLKPIAKEKGYKQVSIYGGGEKPELWLIHILIAKLFIPNPENKPCVGHKDCNPDNNSVDNLYWCTYLENNNHPITLARKSESMKGNTNSKGRVLSEGHKSKISKANSKAIIQYTDDGFVKEWDSMLQAAKEANYDAGCISQCCNGKQKKHKGFKWKFK